MKMGCGLELKIVKGRRYLYLWSYSEEGGRSRRRWKYLGPIHETETRRRALSELSAAYDAARAEMERRLRIARARLARLR